MDELEKREKALEVAEKVKLLFGFSAQLIPDKEMIKEVAGKAGSMVGNVLTMAPIIGAFGGDYEEAEVEARIKSLRAKALYDLVNTLDETEKMRADFAEKKTKKAEGMAQLRKALGI